MLNRILLAVVAVGLIGACGGGGGGNGLPDAVPDQVADGEVSPDALPDVTGDELVPDRVEPEIEDKQILPDEVVQLAPMPAAAGDALITEFMARAGEGTDDPGEWVELFNPTQTDFDLKGCTLKDKAINSHAVLSSVPLPAGSYVVLGKNGDPATNYGVDVAYVYDNFAMGNKGDEIVLDCAGVLIDEVIYDEFVVNEGAAAQLSPDKFDPVLNDDMKSWCKATKEFGPAGKKGTPGAANTACPEPSVCDPNPCTEPPAPTCDPNGTLVITYKETGICTPNGEEPSCVYPEDKQTECGDGNVCVGGECLPKTSPCEPNPCSTPPASACNEAGTGILTFSGPGECMEVPEGQPDHLCTYPSEEALCDEGKICKDTVCRFPAPAAAGDLIVTELMPKSQAGTGDKGEWIELYNPTAATFDLAGCLLKDSGTDQHVVTGELLSAGGTFLLLGRSADPAENHGIEPDYVYAGMTLNNEKDDVTIECGGNPIDTTGYERTMKQGVAWQLSSKVMDANGNDDQANWCDATLTYSEGFYGSPGTANEECIDPCQPNPCTDVPVNACKDDGVLNTYDAVGVCTADMGQAKCDYPAIEVDCAADNKVCKDAACVEKDPCVPNPCTQPPAAACDPDGKTLLTYPVEGTCSKVDGQAACDYPPVSTDCATLEMECKNAECAPPGKDNMPEEHGQLVVSEFMARSQSGTDYGEWVEIYNAGPEAYDLNGCILTDDAGDLHTFAQTLTIKPGEYLVLAKSEDPAQNHGLPFDYVYNKFDLVNGGDTIIIRCNGVDIDIVTYTAAQVVLATALQLDPAKLDAVLNNDAWNWCKATLGYGTADKLGTPGAVNTPCPNPCDPNPCIQPPAGGCDVDGKVLTTYPAVGNCTNDKGAAACDYPATVADCTADGKVCKNAACVVPDPCDPNPCTQPPAAACEADGKTLKSYPAVGTCTNNNGQAKCDYPVTTTDCSATGKVCKSGACVQPDPCDPNPCTTPPGPGCEADGKTLNTWTSPGSCQNVQGQPKCTYPKQTKDCSLDNNKVCKNGACFDLCDPNPCTQPPTPSCDADGKTLFTWASPGNCTNNNGQPFCDYTKQSTDCSLDNNKVCKNGACAPFDPCDPNPCITPPGATCAVDGKTLTSYEPLGNCTNNNGQAQCDYVPVVTDCSAFGKICSVNICKFEGEGNKPTLAGQVVITEFMPKSIAGTPDNGEWFEVFNASAQALDLGSCVIKDVATDSHVIVGPLTFKPGQFLVLARSNDPTKNNGLPVVNYQYGSAYSFVNTGDTLSLVCNDVEIDKVVYTSSWVYEGVAMQLKIGKYDNVANDELANWCKATQTYGTAGKKGTPGADSTACQ